MWLMSTDGFVSVVALQDPVTPKDFDTLVVRGRDVKHLRRIQDHIKAVHNIDIPIHSDIGTDYEHRMFVSKTMFAKYIADYVYEIDYSNFKNRVTTMQKAWTTRGIQALHEIWEILYRKIGRFKPSGSEWTGEDERMRSLRYLMEHQGPDESWDPEKEFL